MHQTYEVVQVRNGARRAVREILLFIVLSALVLFFTDYYNPPVQYRYLEGSIILSVILGVPIGIAVWLLYHILRFAIGR